MFRDTLARLRDITNLIFVLLRDGELHSVTFAFGKTEDVHGFKRYIVSERSPVIPGLFAFWGFSLAG